MEEELDFLNRKEALFNYGREEFVLVELTADKFLSAMKSLLIKKDVVKFINTFDIHLKHKKNIVTNQKIFDEFVQKFMLLHAGSGIEMKGADEAFSEEQMQESLKEFYRSYKKVFSSMWKAGLGNPYELGSKLTLRQIDQWIRDMFPPGEEEKEEIPEERKPASGGRLGFSELPSGAKKVKSWTDSAGFSCRSYEVRIEK